MKIVEINTCDYGSTGKIMLQIANAARGVGHNVYTFSRAWKNQKNASENNFYFGFFLENMFHRIVGPLSGYNECFSIKGTKQLLKKIDIIKPDIIHLHNLHGYYINIKLLFEYIKKNNIPVIWTLHDCWAFTGRCPYFDIMQCDKWKTGCYDCPYPKDLYPEAKFDQTKKMWRLKKEWFTGIENMTIVTPSQWLADLVKQSFLKEYPVKVINNGIDLNIFRPTESNFRQQYAIKDDQFILLGVAFGWGKRKGLDVFIELSKRLDGRFQIVLVGTDDQVDRLLPSNIISIHRTQNQQELAQIYSAADLFVNPTREDNYPTVNMESIACGTPVVTFNTGGSPEMVDEICGSVVECDDIDALEKEIYRIYQTRPYLEEACLNKAKSFDMNDRFQEYVELYECLN